jgi:acetyltransferase-like isoleucine patch superfamily enzyme
VLLSCKGAKIGKKVYLSPRARIIGNINNLCILDGAHISDNVRIYLGQRSKVIIGRSSRINIGTILYGKYGIRIYHQVLVAANVTFVSSSHGFTGRDLIINQPETGGLIRVLSGCWIGTNCCILKSVRVGTGSVIGAMSLVNRNIADFSVAVGVPARHIRYRG